jgi:plastocyanin
LSRIRIALVGLAVVVVGVFVTAGIAAAKPATAKKATVGTVVSVSAKEFSFKLSTKSVSKPGAVVFKVKNNGKEPHNFVFLSGINKGTALILPGKTKSITIVFKKKGSYTYECTVGEHAEEGMLGTFLVK